MIFVSMLAALVAIAAGGSRAIMVDTRPEIVQIRERFVKYDQGQTDATARLYLRVFMIASAVCLVALGLSFL